MRILVVDDRQENCLILKHKLGAHGYDVTSAANGVEALASLRAEKFDAVITDLMMPEMDGFQLTHAITGDDALKKIPVLVYTATYTEQRDKALALNLGAAAFLVKPSEDEPFFYELEQMLARARSGKLQPRTPVGNELDYLREYTSRLIRKLEEKVRDADEANRQLQDFNATLEKRVQAATQELRATNQELEAFAYSVSHDLRSPLRGIQGWAGVILENSPPLSEAEHKEFLRRISQSAEHMQKLVDDLLEYSRLRADEIKLAPIDLDIVIEIVVDRLGPEIRATSAEIVPHPPFPKVLGHETVLVQIVSNLVSNALKFVAKGVTPHIDIFTEEKSDWIRLSIKDNGIGIPPDSQKKIFQVFERLHNRSAYAGTGVGLAIVQRGVEKLGGRAGVDSQTGRGSVFWLDLPVART